MSKKWKKIIDLESQIIEQEHRLIPSLLTFFSRKKWQKNDKRRKSAVISLLWIFFPRISVATAGIGLVGIITMILAYEANVKLENQNTLMTVQNELAESQRRSSLNIELSEIMNEMSDELLSHIDRPEPKKPDISFRQGHKIAKYDLTNITRSRIISISQSFKPYRSLVDTSEIPSEESVGNIFQLNGKSFFTSRYSISNFLDDNYLSPERGQLFLALIKMRVLTGSIGNFNYSDLRKSDLRKSDARGMNLDYSDMENSILVAP